MSVIEVYNQLAKLDISQDDDCSECAEMMHDLYGYDMFTIFFIDSEQNKHEFLWKSRWNDGYADYVYHTFCITNIDGSPYVIDLTTNEKFIPLNEFIEDINQLNQIQGFKFIISRGNRWAWSLKVRIDGIYKDLNTFDWGKISQDTDKIWGYIFVPDMQKYLVIYRLSERSKLVTFALVDAKNNYAKGNELQAHYYPEKYPDDYFIGLGRVFFFKDFYTAEDNLNVSWVDENLNKLLV